MVPPPEGWMKLNSDGPVSGSSRQARAGGLLRNLIEGGFLVLRSEIWGMLQGISLAWRLGTSKLLQGIFF